MEGRNTGNYIDILRKVTNIIKIKPEIVISDFEKAQRKALKTVFPYAKIIGCFFHYSQVIENTHNNKHKMHIFLMLVSYYRRY